MKRIGIRREDKNEWERRVPLVPEHVKELNQKGIEVWLQPSSIRIFTDEEYISAGAVVQEDLSPCPIIFAIKEIPVAFFESGKTYIFFSHTIKGQPHNMPMLRRMMELKCQLIDYEKVVDEKGRRLIFFGHYAGLAGMIDTLWALKERLNYERINNPFSVIRKAHEYNSLQEAKDAIAEVGKKISALGHHDSITPFICGFMGYGNVSKGAQEILDLLPVKEIEPAEIGNVNPNPNIIYKVVFREEDMVELKTKNQKPKTKQEFDLQDYYTHPEKYCAVFERYIPYLTLLVNCIYWDARYPRFVTKKYLRELWRLNPKLKVIGDISCDIEGAIECTLHTTNPGNPAFVYNPFIEQTTMGVAGVGPVVVAVDNLPCELPRESSIYFSGVIKDFIPMIVNADFTSDFVHCNLPRELKDAVILYHGELTPPYKYMNKFL